MTLEEKLKAKSIPLMQKYMWIDQPTEIQKEQVILLKDALSICQQEIDDACKKQREICADAYMPKEEIVTFAKGKLSKKLGAKYIRTCILDAPMPEGDK